MQGLLFPTLEPEYLIAGINKCLAFENEVVPILVLPLAQSYSNCVCNFSSYVNENDRSLIVYYINILILRKRKKELKISIPGCTGKTYLIHLIGETEGHRTRGLVYRIGKM